MSFFNEGSSKGSDSDEYPKAAMYWCECNFQYLWRWMNWLERLDVIVLAVLLVYVALSVAHVSYSLRTATKANSASNACQRRKRISLAGLNLQVRTLNSIAFAAPYLGLGGACLGILSIFRGYDGSRYGYVLLVSRGTAAALISTAAGLLVAIAAVSSHNYLRVQIDLREREISKVVEYANHDFQFAQSLPLTPRFSRFPFAVIAVATLAVAITAFMGLSPFHTSLGLHVRLLPVGAQPESNGSAKPTTVRIVGAISNEHTVVYLNGKRMPLEELRGAVRNELKSPTKAVVYVAAEQTLRWTDVANVIDTIESIPAEVVLLTASPRKTNHLDPKLIR